MQTAARRPGVPQLCHPHCLLMGGIKAFDKLLPGITKQVGGIPRARSRHTKAAVRTSECSCCTAICWTCSIFDYNTDQQVQQSMSGFRPLQLLDAGGTMLDLSQDCYNFDFGMDSGAARGPTDYKVGSCRARLVTCGMLVVALGHCALSQAFNTCLIPACNKHPTPQPWAMVPATGKYGSSRLP